MDGWLAGKTVLVTGAASGIGAAAALRLAAEGAAVCAADIDEAGIAATAAKIGAAGGRCEAVRADIGSEADNRRLVATAVGMSGRLDGAFLNAGMLGSMSGLEGIDAAAFDRIVRTNLYGCFFGLKAALGAIGAGGAVVVTASIAGLLGLPENPAYSASKHGILGLVRSSAKAFAARGARVNAICPGGVATPMAGVMEAPEIVPAGSLPVPPWRGMVAAQHVAELALFLLSPRSGGMNGACLTVDAGFTAAIAN